ncbi:MAG: orotidine 5'-phosphate decarboxylase [Candidatus Diapherotrites archaeon]|uniref:Orotidine 5'-phosphate decarboxylase n=1 Tax=Candidatus Iainarchaeum sp. TaxID=3101447 RepID=A0A938YNY3_9ARCH|nr:orotidine 5'-phosphate decarboxylase [Candidatus Diapherotrites archaeon]
MGKIIEADKSIIPACDVATLKELEELVKATAKVKGVGAYKVGFVLGLGFGLENVVKAVRKHSNKPIIYDHQKAGTDIPEMGQGFAAVCKQAGVDAVIFFPQAGPATEKAWIEAAQAAGLGVIVGGEMTHPNYLKGDNGFIDDAAPKRMYATAIDAGVTDFVVPGNKPEKIVEYKEFFESKGIEPVLYSPGLVAQGGELTESAKAAGKRWHAIVGRGIYKAEDRGKAAAELSSKL